MSQPLRCCVSRKSFAVDSGSHTAVLRKARMTGEGGPAPRAPGDSFPYLVAVATGSVGRCPPVTDTRARLIALEHVCVGKEEAGVDKSCAASTDGGWQLGNEVLEADLRAAPARCSRGLLGAQDSSEGERSLVSLPPNQPW